MGDLKSKLPDLKELASMTGKLFGDIKTSVSEIIQEYKQNRAQAEANEKMEEMKKEAPPVNEVPPVKEPPLHEVPPVDKGVKNEEEPK